MTWQVRPARGSDVDALYRLAEMTGGGFTNLPADRVSLAARLAWSDRSFARADGPPDDELYVLLLENIDSGEIGGCGMVFSRIGAQWPFYSYKLASLSQTSKQLDRSFRLPFLSLVSDHDGASEVGGLFLLPALRTAGLGRLLARSRYLFIAQHRGRFGDRVIAELRGVLDDDGNSPFWDALGAKFFGMPFPEADKINAINGNQFIADLMPKHPIYTALLPQSARDVIGQPHAKGRAALAMLEAEGFRFDNYVDIFDGGPTVVARTDDLRSVRESRLARVAALCGSDAGCERTLLATGHLAAFRAWCGQMGPADGPGGCVVPEAEAAAMELTPGDEVRHVFA